MGWDIEACNGGFGPHRLDGDWQRCCSTISSFHCLKRVVSESPGYSA